MTDQEIKDSYSDVQKYIRFQAKHISNLENLVSKQQDYINALERQVRYEQNRTWWQKLIGLS